MVKKNFMKGLLDGNVVTSFIRSYNTNVGITQVQHRTAIPSAGVA